MARKKVPKNLWLSSALITFYIYFIIVVIALVVIFALRYFDLIPAETNISMHGLIGFFSVTLLCAFLISTIVNRFVLEPIRKLKDSMNQVITSDFSIQLDAEAQGANDIRELYQAFNIMVQELHRIESFQNNFLSTISHEFKTPITSIRGNAQLLKEADLSPQEEDLALTNIMEGADRLSSMSSNILLITKLESQSVAVPKENFRLDEQIRNTLLLFQQQWTEKELELQLNLPAVQYYGNEDLLAHVWTNLIDNAIKYNRVQGSLSIEIVEDAQDLHVIIQDTGIGFNSSDQEQLFDKFYQADQSRSDKGNGLGLAIVKLIVNLHGGDVTASSSPEGGASFTVSLPKDDPSL